MHQAESGSSSYGLAARLRLLSTPPRDDAVTVGYSLRRSSGEDFHLSVYVRSRAHYHGQLGRGQVHGQVGRATVGHALSLPSYLKYPESKCPSCRSDTETANH